MRLYLVPLLLPCSHMRIGLETAKITSTNSRVTWVPINAVSRSRKCAVRIQLCATGSWLFGDSHSRPVELGPARSEPSCHPWSANAEPSRYSHRGARGRLQKSGVYLVSHKHECPLGRPIRRPLTGPSG